MLERRYGTRRPGRRLAVIVVTVLVAGAGLGWLFWAAIVHANPAVDADVAGFHVKSVHRVEATVEVRVRDNDSAGTCLLRASAQDHSVVGEHRFRVDSSTGRETTRAGPHRAAGGHGRGRRLHPRRRLRRAGGRIASCWVRLVKLTTCARR